MRLVNLKPLLHFYPINIALMKASVIFSTYNSTAWLEKVLWGFSKQTTKDFEILIADDGSVKDGGMRRTGSLESVFSILVFTGYK